MKKFKSHIQSVLAIALVLVSAVMLASSHREAPLIANDPLADNTDLYAFRSPDDPNTITIIANYVPLQLPHGGPNYHTFGENVRYEVHIDNDVSTAGDDIIYRFTFDIVNEDPTTFFNIRLGAQNQKATYTCQRSMDGGATWTTIVSSGIVPPNNIGDRSIEGGAGLGTDYNTLFNAAITTATTGEKIFCGPVDDPFFVDLAGVFDLGDMPRQSGMPKDGVSCMNVSTIAIQVPISTLQKDGLAVSAAANILDSDFVIGVWASASRQQIRTLNVDGTDSYSGDWVQVSRLGMPLTNEAVIAIGDKDYWNSLTPYDEIGETSLDGYFYNPELGLYMDDDLFGGAVPAMAPLRIQRNSLGLGSPGAGFDFGNGNDGLYPLKNSPAVAGTALDDAIFGTLLLPGPGLPRSVDLWPIFHTGAPNLAPYHLATGKGGDPLANGKPFINNFLPNGGDMLRLNMAVPPTDRDDPAFSHLGLVQAAVLGLTDPTYAADASLQAIPNMDGFPNGRRLEDDVTTIELQAVSGIVLAAIGLWYDDFDGTNPVSQDLLDVLTYDTGVNANDVALQSSFPYVAQPHSGTGPCSGEEISYVPVPANNSAGNAQAIEIKDFGTCETEGGSLQNALASGSQGSADVWYSIQPLSPGIRVEVNTADFDALIEIRDEAMNLIDFEDVVLGGAGEALNFGGLTPGQNYFVVVGSIGSTGNGEFSICIQELPDSQCDYGSGPYSLCSVFKADWVFADGYVFNFTSQTDGEMYSLQTVGTSFMQFKNVPGLQWGDTYDVAIQSYFDVEDGAGNSELVVIDNVTPCEVILSPVPETLLRASDNCANHGPHFLGGYIAATPFVCGVADWEWMFERTDIPELPINHLRGSSNRYMRISDVSTLQPGATYDVSVRPVFANGATPPFGAVDCLSIIGSSGIAPDGDWEEEMTMEENLEKRVIEDPFADALLYPNPASSEVTVTFSGADEDKVLILELFDSVGRLVTTEQYASPGSDFTTTIDVTGLTNGVYMVALSSGNLTITKQLLVSK